MYLSWFEYSIKLVPRLAAGSHILSSLSQQYITLVDEPYMITMMDNSVAEETTLAAKLLLHLKLNTGSLSCNRTKDACHKKGTRTKST